MRRYLLAISFVLFTCSTLPLFAQKKDFSYQQLFENAKTDVSKSLPIVTKWLDDEHYLESRRDEVDGKMKLMNVEVKSGKAVPYEEETQIGTLPTAPADAKNVTYSPDRKYAAFTLNNN